MKTMQHSSNSLGARLYSLRKYRNFSLQELCEITGISRSNLNRYERGVSKPTSDYLKILCEFYHVSADWLLFGVQTEELQKEGWAGIDPQLKEMLSRLVSLMTSDEPNVRSWAIVQFGNAFNMKN